MFGVQGNRVVVYLVGSSEEVSGVCELLEVELYKTSKEGAEYVG